MIGKVSIATDAPPVRPAREVPRDHGPKLLQLRALRRDPLGTFRRLHHDHGAIVRLGVPGVRLYLVTEPDEVRDALTGTGRGYAKGFVRRGGDPSGPGIQPLAPLLGDGLLTSTGELWRHQRRLIQPLFHGARIAEYADSFVRLAESHCSAWPTGVRLDLHREMAELTLAIVARTVFDVDLDAEVVTRIRRALSVNQAAARRRVVPWGRLADRMPLPSTRRFAADRAALDAVVHRLIAQRRERGSGTDHDLLGLLLATRDEHGDPMPDRLVRDEAMTLLLAGHETTANALAWAMHLLATHPTAQRALIAELDQVLGERSASAADVPRLRYTAAVVHESMRLFPPAWVLGRRLAADRTVCGFALPAGAMLVLAPWVVHRDPRWWPEPDRFRPERWLVDDDRPRYAYFPFGGGPRQCIGNGFAEMEAILVLATVCRRRWLEPEGPAPTPLPLVTLRPGGGVWCTVQQR